LSYARNAAGWYAVTSPGRKKIHPHN